MKREDRGLQQIVTYILNRVIFYSPIQNKLKPDAVPSVFDVPSHLKLPTINRKPPTKRNAPELEVEGNKSKNVKTVPADELFTIKQIVRNLGVRWRLRRA